MLDTVLDDVKSDYSLLEKSNVTRDGAMAAVRNTVLKYVATGTLSYPEGVRLVSCLLLILVTFKEGTKNGNQR